jgi:hypothetical protein
MTKERPAMTKERPAMTKERPAMTTAYPAIPRLRQVRRPFSPARPSGKSAVARVRDGRGS